MSGNEHTTPLVQSLGKVTLAGRSVRVTWPGIGDAVGIDFSERPPGRYGIVAGLKRGRPILLIEPAHEGFLDAAAQQWLLIEVAKLWREAAKQTAFPSFTPRPEAAS